ncbi:MAG: hypothetical protein AB1790_03370 [Pseudomonadota bacterium]
MGPEVSIHRRQLARVITLFAFSPQARKIIYTTNAIEGHLPRDDATIKLIYLAQRQIEAKWKRLPQQWHTAKAQLAIQFGQRFTLDD